MTYNPVTLQALAKYWVAQEGVNLGIVGDTAHAAKGYSYHLGRDQLSPTAYSVQTARDKAGLTNGASAIDLGRLNGTLMALRTFSKWLVEEARRNAPGTSDIREIIYSPDGKVVLRWDRQRGYNSLPRPGEADDSHLTHTHISFYRDAEQRDHTTAFRPYFEEPVRNFTILYDADKRVIPATLTFPDAGAKVLILATDKLIGVNTAWRKPGIKVRLKDPIVAGKPRTDEWMLGWLIGDDAAFALDRNVSVIPSHDIAKPYTVTISGAGKNLTVGTVTLP